MSRFALRILELFQTDSPVGMHHRRGERTFAAKGMWADTEVLF